MFTINVGAVIISEAALSSLGFELPDLGERLTNDGLDAPTQQCLRAVDRDTDPLITLRSI